MTINCDIPILGFAAYSGTGKTTLLINLIPLLKKHGLNIGVIKHAHHAFEIDQPGKDSYKIRKSGANQMLIGSRERWALMVEQEQTNHIERLQEYINQFDTTKLDIILVEGFKPEAIPKIELHRPSLGHTLLCVYDSSIIAIACDEKPKINHGLTQLNLNDYQSISDYIINIFIN